MCCIGSGLCSNCTDFFSLFFAQVFDEMNLKAYDLSVDTLDVHAVSDHVLVLFITMASCHLLLILVCIGSQYFPQV